MRKTAYTFKKPRKDEEYEVAVEQLKEDLTDQPDVRALVMLFWETGIRFQEAYTITADEFCRGVYHSPKMGQQDLELPSVSEETRKMIMELITEEGTIFKKPERYYQIKIRKHSGGISALELISYKRRQRRIWDYEAGDIIL